MNTEKSFSRGNVIPFINSVLSESSPITVHPSSKRDVMQIIHPLGLGAHHYVIESDPFHPCTIEHVSSITPSKVVQSTTAHLTPNKINTVDMVRTTQPVHIHHALVNILFISSLIRWVVPPSPSCNN